jgi:hypothetical protein
MVEEGKWHDSHMQRNGGCMRLARRYVNDDLEGAAPDVAWHQRIRIAAIEGIVPRPICCLAEVTSTIQ